jgi:hypothetical protein
MFARGNLPAPTVNAGADCHDAIGELFFGDPQQYQGRHFQ